MKLIKIQGLLWFSNYFKYI